MRLLNGCATALAAGVLAAAGGAPTSPALALPLLPELIISFDEPEVGLEHGSLVANQYVSHFGLGLVIRANSFARDFDHAVAFDSSQRNTPDADLETSARSPFWSRGNIRGEELGRILILQENDEGCGDGACDDPDDEGDKPAGTITFDFQNVELTSFGFDVVDVESASTENGMVSFFQRGEQGSADLLVGMVSFADFAGRDGVRFGNHSANRIAPISAESLGADYFDKVVVKLAGSGALDNLVLSSPAIIPEPATAPLLGLGATALAAWARRRRR